MFKAARSAEKRYINKVYYGKISRFSHKYHKRGMPNDPFVLFGMWEKGRNFAIVKKKQNKNINNMLLWGVARPNIHMLFKSKRSQAVQ